MKNWSKISNFSLHSFHARLRVAFAFMKMSSSENDSGYFQRICVKFPKACLLTSRKWFCAYHCVEIDLLQVPMRSHSSSSFFIFLLIAVRLCKEIKALVYKRVTFRSRFKAPKAFRLRKGKLIRAVLVRRNLNNAVFMNFLFRQRNNAFKLFNQAADASKIYQVNTLYFLYYFKNAM